MFAGQSGVHGDFDFLVAEDFLQPGMRTVWAAAARFGRLPWRSKDAVAVEVEDVHGRFGRALRGAGSGRRAWAGGGIPRRRDRARAGQWRRAPAGNRRADRESRCARRADEEEEMEEVFRGGLEGERVRLSRAGYAAANADARRFHERGSRRRTRGRGAAPTAARGWRMLGGDGEQAESSATSWNALKRRWAARPVNAASKSCFPQRRLFDASGFLVVRVAKRMGTVGFDIPGEVAEILIRDRIGERQFARFFLTQTNDDVAGFGKAEVQFLLT